MARKTAKAVAPEPAELESLARAALEEVTPPAEIGAHIETRPGPEEGLTDVVFEPLQRGYAGWSWVVTVAQVHDAVTGEAVPPTVAELALIPGDGALLAPEWVPWSVRLAEWEAQQKALAAEAGEDAAASEQDDDEDAPDVDDLDEDDVDEDDLDDEGLDDEGLDDEFEEDDDADEDPDADDDFDADEDGPTRTHGGDIDGVDIDDLDVDED